MKKQNGITLIALVITIVVLLILAAVSINAILGDNGILNRATQSKDDTNKGKREDLIQIAINSAITDGITEGKISDADSTASAASVTWLKSTDAATTTTIAGGSKIFSDQLVNQGGTSGVIKDLSHTDNADWNITVTYTSASKVYCGEVVIDGVTYEWKTNGTKVETRVKP